MRSSISFRTSSPAASLSMRAYNEFQLGRNSAASSPPCYDLTTVGANSQLSGYE